MNVLLVELNPFMSTHVPISLGYLAAYLKKDGFAIRIINVGADTTLSLHRLSNFLTSFRPSLVGFSTYQRNMHYVRGWAGYIKRLLPEVKIIIGGPQATFMPSRALLVMSEIDLICRSEGELVILAVARALRDGIPLSSVSGISFRDEEGRVEEGTPIRRVPEDLDLYPSPYLDQVIELGDLEEAILLASRGCPFKCIFCYTPNAFQGRVRHHSVERVLEELQWLEKKGVRRCWFADPSFSHGKDRIHKLLDDILTRGIRIEIWLETRADLVDMELLSKMRRAGVTMVAYGLESGSERVINTLKKRISLDVVKEAVKLTHENGIEVELFSQYGLPNETYEDALKTLAFVKGCGVKIKGNSNAQQTQIYFGTELQRRSKSYGIHPLKKRLPPYMSLGIHYETEWLSNKEIQQIRALWSSHSLDGGKRQVS